MSEPVEAEEPGVWFPEELAFLFEPARYKVAYGGRGSGKTWNFGRALLIQGADRPLRVLCAREIQKSIRESVHQLLRDQIPLLGLDGFYEVLDTEIRGKNGTLFFFAGLKHNIDNIKSKEGIDIAWVEEAQTVSKASWDKLIPTVRKPGSEIWIGFNPELDTDETYKRFVLDPPTGAIVRKVNWSDNFWFPAVLDQERLDLQARDPDAYLTVWEGHCKQTLDGAVYANELRAATSEGRICRVPYDANHPVHTVWDLGRADKTSIWFLQTVGFEFRVIDFFEDRGHAFPHYLKALQDKPYVWGTDYLPHDAEAEQLAAERTVAQQARNAGRTVVVLPRADIAGGINAARSIFPRCWFDEERTRDGLNALRRYCYDVDPETGTWSKNPRHDDYSHAADAFRYLAMSVSEPRKPRPKFVRRSGGSWMG